MCIIQSYGCIILITVLSRTCLRPCAASVRTITALDLIESSDMEKLEIEQDYDGRWEGFDYDDVDERHRAPRGQPQGEESGEFLLWRRTSTPAPAPSPRLHNFARPLCLQTRSKQHPLQTLQVQDPIP